MNIVTLDNDGMIKKGELSTVSDPLTCLGCQVELSPDYTLRSFFKLLKNYEVLQKLNAFFPELINQYEKSPDSGCRISNMDCLVLGKTNEIIGFPGNPRLESYRTFNGINGGKPVEIKDYQLEFLLDIRIALGKLKHVIFGDIVDVFEFDTVFTFFEFIDGIGWELGFHGTPRECQIVSDPK